MRYIVLGMVVLFSFAEALGQSGFEQLSQWKKQFNEAASIESGFTFKVIQPEQNQIIEEGTYVQSGELYVLDLGMQRINFDGQDIYVYIRDQNEIQINSYDPDDESIAQLNPIKLIATMKKDDFDYRQISESSFEIKPVQPDDYKKVRFTTKEGQLKMVEFFSTENVKYIVEFTAIHLDTKRKSKELFDIPKALFEQARIEDLRF